MPNPMLINIADRVGMKLEVIEDKWEIAKKVTSEDFGVPISEFSEEEYNHAKGVLNTMVGLEESKRKGLIEKFLNSKYRFNEFVEKEVLRETDIFSFKESKITEIIQVGDTCTVDMSKIGRSKVSEPQWYGLLTKAIRNGEGTVYVGDIDGDKAGVRAWKFDLLGDVYVPLDSLTKVNENLSKSESKIKEATGDYICNINNTSEGDIVKYNNDYYKIFWIKNGLAGLYNENDTVDVKLADCIGNYKWSKKYQSGSNIDPNLYGLEESKLKESKIDLIVNTYQENKGEVTLEEETLPVFKVTYDNGDSIITSMAKGITLDDAKKYYLGKQFNLGSGSNDLMAIAVKVEQLKEDAQVSSSLGNIATSPTGINKSKDLEVVEAVDGNVMAQSDVPYYSKETQEVIESVLKERSVMGIPVVSVRFTTPEGWDVVQDFSDNIGAERAIKSFLKDNPKGNAYIVNEKVLKEEVYSKIQVIHTSIERAMSLLSGLGVSFDKEKDDILIIHSSSLPFVEREFLKAGVDYKIEEGKKPMEEDSKFKKELSIYLKPDDTYGFIGPIQAGDEELSRKTFVSYQDALDAMREKGYKLKESNQENSAYRIVQVGEIRGYDKEQIIMQLIKELNIGIEDAEYWFNRFSTGLNEAYTDKEVMTPKIPKEVFDIVKNSKDIAELKKNLKDAGLDDSQISYIVANELILEPLTEQDDLYDVGYRQGKKGQPKWVQFEDDEDYKKGWEEGNKEKEPVKESNKVDPKEVDYWYMLGKQDAKKQSPKKTDFPNDTAKDAYNDAYYNSKVPEAVDGNVMATSDVPYYTKETQEVIESILKDSIKIKEKKERANRIKEKVVVQIRDENVPSWDKFFKEFYKHIATEDYLIDDSDESEEGKGFINFIFFNREDWDALEYIFEPYKYKVLQESKDDSIFRFKKAYPEESKDLTDEQIMDYIKDLKSGKKSMDKEFKKFIGEDRTPPLGSTDLKQDPPRDLDKIDKVEE